MGSRLIRSFMIGAVVMLVFGGLFWLVQPPKPETEQPSRSAGGSVAVLPSDGGTDGPPETASSSPPADTETREPTNDPADSEQVAREFMTRYPGAVQALADPTFLASLDGVDASLLNQISGLSLEQTDHATGELYERYAYTISGIYQGEPMPIYTIVVARPVEPGEGGSAVENDLPFQVHSFDWAPNMLGDATDPGPAAGELSPITAQQRVELIDKTRTNVITPVLTVHPGESPEQRQARLDALSIEPITVTPPMSRSGRYAMTTEILSHTYSTQRDGPITITYTGTWVDPYEPTHNGAWTLTATITRDGSGTFIVHSVEETTPSESNGNDE